MIIRSKEASDNDRLATLWAGRWGAPVIVARGKTHDPLDLPGFVAEEDGKIVGALTFERIDGEIEVITLDSFAEDKGVGTALLDAAVALGRAEGAFRLCLVTSNDNIRALRFYQRRGWNISAFYRDAVAAARKIKPQIPLLGDHDIPIKHEIEFEFRLA